MQRRLDSKDVRVAVFEVTAWPSPLFGSRPTEVGTRP